MVQTEVLAIPKILGKIHNDGCQAGPRYCAVGGKPNTSQKDLTVAPFPCALQGGSKCSRLLVLEDCLQSGQIGIDFLTLQRRLFGGEQVLSCLIGQQNSADCINCDDCSWTAFDERTKLLLAVLAQLDLPFKFFDVRHRNSSVADHLRNEQSCANKPCRTEQQADHSFILR